MTSLQYKALINCIDNHVYLLDQDETFLLSNKRVPQFSSQKSNEIIGEKLQDIYPADIYKIFKRYLREVHNTEEVVKFEFSTIHDNIQRYYQNTFIPVRDGESTFVIAGNCQDVTEIKRIESQLIQAQKMEALGIMVAGVAHEINNPVGLILLNLPLLRKIWIDLLRFIISTDKDHFAVNKFGGVPFDFLNENILQLIDDMYFAGNRITKIVSDLKAFARIEDPADKENIQINEAVKNAVRLASATKTCRKTNIKMDLAPDMPFVRANLQNIEQIVLNLIINALQAIEHDKGEVIITTSKVESEKYVKITVQDNGSGINPSISDNIYAPFVTDRQQMGGTGLGLSLCYSMVKEHKGEIYFDSKQNCGTTFNVLLPIISMSKKCRIMIVDDDNAFRRMLKKALTKETSYIVEDFSNGFEALIRIGSNPPDLLILDMFMPDLDGIGVCRAVKNEIGLEMTKVIIITGYPEHENIKEAMKMGIQKVLNKPIIVDVLLKAVKESLDGKLTL